MRRMQERNIHFRNIEAEFDPQKPELFSPWDVFAIVTPENITMVQIGPAGARDTDEYKNDFKSALKLVESAYEKGQGDVDILLLSSYVAMDKLEYQGLGVSWPEKVTVFSMEEFKKVHPEISPVDYIISKKTLH